MKTWYLLPFVLLAGLMIGRYLPIEELRTASRPQERRNARRTAETPPETRQGGFNEITRMVNIPDRATATPDPAAASSRVRRSRDVPQGARADAPPQTDGQPSAPSPEDIQLRLDEARGLWQTRVEIARAQTLDTLGLTAETASVAFDAAIDTMNDSLATAIQEIADEIQSQDTVTPEMGVRFLNEVTAILTIAYDDLAHASAPEHRDTVSDLRMTDFIDPAVIEPLIPLHDKFRAFRP